MDGAMESKILGMQSCLNSNECPVMPASVYICVCMKKRIKRNAMKNKNKIITHT